MDESVNKKLIRSADKMDAPGILRVLEGAFKTRKGSSKWKNWESLVIRDPGDWRVLIVDKEIIGTLHIGRYWLKIGRSKILKGDVGEVAIIPRHQGKGYGTVLLEDTMAWMGRQRYDISRLGGLVKFYSRFGYLRFPRRYMEISGFDGTNAATGRKRKMAAEGFKCGIRLFNPGKDLSSCLKIYNEFNRPYNASLIFSEKNKVFAGPESPGPLDIVFEEDGKINGYLVASMYKEEITEFQARITIYDIAYRRTKPYILESMIKYISGFASGNGIARVTARIPFDPEVIAVLSSMPVNFQTVETYGGKASNMLQIVNLQSLFGRLIPEMENRLKYSAVHSWSGILEIKTEKDAVQLHINKGKIEITRGEKANLRISLSEFYLLKLILGLISFSEIKDILEKDAKFKTEEISLLAGLFPRELVSSSNWG